MPLQNITRNNHYVPQATLQRWSDDGAHVYAYRLLLSHSNVPEWEHRTIRGLAQQPDLYTVLSDGKEEDEFETFITRGFEEPGQQAIEKLLSRSSMKPADWHSIARFVVAQDLRTPLHFLEWMPQFKKHMGKAFKETIRKYEAMDQDRRGRIRYNRTSRRELLGEWLYAFRSIDPASREGMRRFDPK